jgi:hypothetical protein
MIWVTTVDNTGTHHAAFENRFLLPRCFIPVL